MIMALLLPPNTVLEAEDDLRECPSSKNASPPITIPVMHLLYNSIATDNGYDEGIRGRKQSGL
jgi:hypothetical protein